MVKVQLHDRAQHCDKGLERGLQGQAQFSHTCLDAWLPAVCEWQAQQPQGRIACAPTSVNASQPVHRYQACAAV